MDTFKLNVFDADELLGQLKSGVPPHALSKPDGSKYPHWDVLHSYFLTSDITKRETWAQCLRLLISLNAPINQTDKSAGDLLLSGVWDPTPELSASLAHEYINAGLFEIDKPAPGQQPNTKRLKPLGAAILWSNHGLVRVLCEAGANWNLGPVFGGSDQDAYEYAEKKGSVEVLAVLTEHLMLDRLRGQAPVNSDIRGSSEPRRRLGAV